MEGYAEDLPAEAKVNSCASTSTKVDHRRTYAMYGRPTLKRAALFTPLRVVDKELTLHPSITRSLYCLTQLRRVQVVTRHMKQQRVLAGSCPSLLVHNTWNVQQHDFQKDDCQLPSDLQHLTSCSLVYTPRLLVSLLTAQKHLQQLHDRLNFDLRTEEAKNYGKKRVNIGGRHGERGRHVCLLQTLQQIGQGGQNGRSLCPHVHPVRGSMEPSKAGASWHRSRKWGA